ncbi:putative odorant receptor 92a [Chelonus insularis]|uniref:putative odorant receptor 92a n=1 Tax=Chelonus insularis TaxID=460826 RepID=UPI001589FF03|nr:putative odorant receptor 92a [Chelonus insularis]
MNFLNVNKFNALTNDLSGNCFPVQSDDKQISNLKRAYIIGTFCYILLYYVSSIKGLISFPTLKSIQDGSINLLVLSEVIILTVYMNYHRDKYRSLIANINTVLSYQSKTLRDITFDFVNPVMRIFTYYTIVAVGSIVIWVCIPMLRAFNKTIFTIEDLQVPIDIFLNKNCGISVYVIVTALEAIACAYAILKKIAIDIYVLYFITLLTAKYVYVQYQLSVIFSDLMNEKSIEVELEQLLHQYSIIVSVTHKLSKLLFINVAVTYINCTLKFCFLAFMVITIPGSYFSKILVVSYSCGSLVEVYIVCFRVNHLVEVSSSISDKAFHTSWYCQKRYFRKIFTMLTMTNMMKCRLSICDSIDLSLPAFMTILKNAYSICLLLLRIK